MKYASICHCTINIYTCMVLISISEVMVNEKLMVLTLVSKTFMSSTVGFVIR